MEFRTPVAVSQPPFLFQPMEKVLFVGSCFATNIGQKFVEEKFRAVVNPFGTMYNPVSVLHTIDRIEEAFDVVVITLGTNHVYIERATGEIVDNCRKRPQRLFEEKELSIEECFEALQEAYERVSERNPAVKIMVTVSPIRYAKYGYHESQLSKATLLLAADRFVKAHPESVYYFPAYEILNDELRDYRFYAEDMLHPNNQAVAYIWERLAETCFSDSLKTFLKAWEPIKEALGHRPFNPASEEYKDFLERTKEKARALQRQYPLLELDF